MFDQVIELFSKIQSTYRPMYTGLLLVSAAKTFARCGMYEAFPGTHKICNLASMTIECKKRMNIVVSNIEILHFYMKVLKMQLNITERNVSLK